jgi:THAP domain
LWASQLKEQGFEPGQFTTICSEHFEEDCFIETKFRRELKPNAIPTIFKAETDQKKRKRSQDAFLDHKETTKKIAKNTVTHFLAQKN